MSRGPGRIQRAVLDYLNTSPGRQNLQTGPDDVPLIAVTRAVFGTDQPTESQRATVRRAVRTLYAAGKLQLTERVAEGKWDRSSEFARFYWRRGRFPYQGLDGTWRQPMQKVPVAEMYVSRLPTEEEKARCQAAMRQMAAEAKALGPQPRLGALSA